MNEKTRETIFTPDELLKDTHREKVPTNTNSSANKEYTHSLETRAVLIEIFMLC